MTVRSLLAAMVLLALAASPSAQAQSRDPSFTMVNRGSVPLRELFVTPAGDPNWGRNRLDRGPLLPGGRFEVLRRHDGRCIMDIRVVYADGRTEDRRALNTCAVDAVAVGEAATGPKRLDDPSFRLVNRGSQPIAALFATPSGMTNWGENRLIDGTLPPETEKLVHIDRTGNCLFDVRVVFADQKALEKHHANLCRITDLPVP